MRAPVSRSRPLFSPCALLARAVSLNYEHGGDTTTGDDRSTLPLLDAFPTTDTRTNPETRLLASEQLRTVVSTLPSLTERERRALAGALDGRSYAELGPVIGGSTKAASHASDRARRKLAGRCARQPDGLPTRASRNDMRSRCYPLLRGCYHLDERPNHGARRRDRARCTPSWV